MLHIIMKPSPISALFEPITLTYVDSYSHTISAAGYFDTASFTTMEAVDEYSFPDLVGASVEVYYEGVKAWEGFLNNINLVFGGLTVSAGPYLDIRNKVRVKYAGSYTANAEDTLSQSKYGVRSMILSSSTSSSTVAARHRDVYLKQNKDLKIVPASISYGEAGKSYTFDCLGYNNLLDFAYYDATSAVITVPEKVNYILDAEPNGILTGMPRYIDASTLSVQRQELEYPEAKSLLSGMAAMGADSSDNAQIYWGFKENRSFIWKEEPMYPEYLWSYKNNLVVDTTGVPVPAALLRPGKRIQVIDFPKIHNIDPRVTSMSTMFIGSVNFSTPNTFSLSPSTSTRLSVQLSKLGLGGF